MAISKAGSHEVCRAYTAVTGKPVPYICYVPATEDREARWRVVCPGRVTDARARAADHGHKVFPVAQRSVEAEQLDAAKAWAQRRFGVDGWTRSSLISGGDWLPREVVDWFGTQSPTE